MTSTPLLSPRARTTRALAGAALLGATLLALPVLRDQWTNTRLEAAVLQDMTGAKPLPWAEGGENSLCDHGCPPRALAASGVRLTLQAAKELNWRKRHALLTQAKSRLDSALAVRPFSGGWWTWLAYARALDGDEPSATLSALTRSYEAAPFLPSESVWRVAYAAQNWESLSPMLRRRVIDEAIWMRDVDPDNAEKVFPQFASPAAAEALRLGMMRPRSNLVPHRRSGSPG